jgi:hypothetical protein
VSKKTKKRLKKLDLTKPVERPRMPISVMARTFLLGSVAIAASGYAIYRHYYVERPSMLMPVPPAVAPAPDPASSGLLPAPDLVPVPASSP